MAILLSSLLFLTLFIHLGAGGAPPYPRPDAVGDLLLTEVRDEPAGQVFIEVHNEAGSNLQGSDFALVIDGQWQNLGGLGLIQNGRYRTIGDGAADDLALTVPLDPQGAVIELYQFGAVIDSVRTGKRGASPDAIPGASTSRYFDGAAYHLEWSMDLSPTWRAQNDGGGRNAFPELVINEVYFSAPTAAERFVELYYRGDVTQPLQGYSLAGNSRHLLMTVLSVSPTNRHFLVWNSDGATMASLFNGLLAGTDNVYLYDPAGNLLDEVGWGTAHASGASVCRTTDGQRSFGGYDDGTSVGAGWQFGCAPNPAWITVEPSTMQYALPGDTVTYAMAVTGRRLTPTLIDLAFPPPPAGWTVALLDAAGTAPLSDSDGDGDPDLLVGALGSGAETQLFTATVSVPASILQDRYVLVITATDAQGGIDDAALDTRLYPIVDLARSAAPGTIYVQGTGFQERTTLTLEVRGRGVAIDSEASNAADVVFVIDDTGSMGNAIDALKNDVNDLTDRLAENVSSLRLGLVSFKDANPWEIDVDIDLTFDVDAFKAAVNTLFASGGGDGPEDADIALQVAANLSWRPGNVTRGMVLITDAPTHNDIHETEVARWAWQVREIHTNTVVVGSIWIVPPATILCLADVTAEYWLNRTAENGTGSFEHWYQQPPPPLPPVCPTGGLGQTLLAGLMDLIPAIDVAAKDPDVTDPDPMVRDVLPPYITFVPGTFRDPATGAPRPPDSISTDGLGDTVLEWNISEIKVGELWSVAFEATSSLVGLVPTNVYGLSRVSYTNWSGAPHTALFPEVDVLVIDPVYLPPRNVTTVWDGASTVGLTWVEPPPPVDHYLIYRALGDPRGFADLRPTAAYASVPAPATSWTDPEPLTGPGERYYLMRASGPGGGNLTATTNTAGVYALLLRAGSNAISRPLEYFPWVDYSGPTVDTVAEHLAQFGGMSIDSLDASGRWERVPGGDPARVLELGRAYVLQSTGGLAVFTGLPGAMLQGQSSAFAGFDPAAEGRSLTAAVTGDDIRLSWDAVPGAAGLTYEVWYSPTRTGFFDGSASRIATVAGPFPTPITATHVKALLASPEAYYSVVPVESVLGAGTSSYSIGVWSRTYTAKDTFALPLRTASVGAISSYADAVPGALGLLALLPTGAWIPHFAEMQAGTYDAAAPLGTGFQIEVRLPTRFVHVGW